MEFSAKQMDDLAKIVARVIGDKLNGLSKPQENILNRQLGRVIRSRNGDVSQVTDEQIIGAYEMIEEVWGAPFEAHYQELQRQKSQ